VLAAATGTKLAIGGAAAGAACGGVAAAAEKEAQEEQKKVVDNLADQNQKLMQRAEQAEATLRDIRDRS
jgi:hypothetical protein